MADPIISATAGAMVAPAILVFLGWLLVSGAIGWSSQLQMLVIIGFGIWVLMRK